MTASTDHHFEELLATAEATSLHSRNHNDELIGVDFCQPLPSMSDEQLSRLQQAWHYKHRQTRKEKVSAQFMIVQLTVLMLAAAVSAWFIGGVIGIITSLVGIMGLFIVIDSKRVTQAKKNLRDAEQVCVVLEQAIQSSPNCP